MENKIQKAVVVAIPCFFVACLYGGRSDFEPLNQDLFIRQKIPIEIQKGKPVIVQIRTRSPGGEPAIGMRCSPDLWHSLTNGPNAITVQMLSSNKKEIQLKTMTPGFRAEFPIKSFYGLFYLIGMQHYHNRVSLQINFPNAPAGKSHAEIIVCRMAGDTP